MGVAVALVVIAGPARHEESGLGGVVEQVSCRSTYSLFQTTHRTQLLL